MIDYEDAREKSGEIRVATSVILKLHYRQMNHCHCRLDSDEMRTNERMSNNAE